MNATMRKFGYPGSCVYEGEHWVVLLRPQQVTLAALVLCAKSEASRLGSLPAEAYGEFGRMTGLIEASLSRFRAYDKINFLALMMVDPHVHFHVLPRYAASQTFRETSFADPGWPALPDLKAHTELDENTRKLLTSELVDAFGASG